MSHWGAFEAKVEDGRIVALHPFRHDPDPSPLLENPAARGAPVPEVDTS
jgi:biotin/methionine sulfoxide reductase